MSLLANEQPVAFLEAIQHKIIPSQEVQNHSERLKGQGKSIVTLNGSFDLLHPGHYEMMYQASLQGDCLWMLLNSDASIKQYKSPKRPINPLNIRLLQIAAIEMVDYVSWFEETDPVRILSSIAPNVHANGSEYGEDCLEAETVKAQGGRIHICALIEGFSSTNLIKKIQELCD